MAAGDVPVGYCPGQKVVCQNDGDRPDDAIDVRHVLGSFKIHVEAVGKDYIHVCVVDSGDGVDLFRMAARGMMLPNGSKTSRRRGSGSSFVGTT